MEQAVKRPRFAATAMAAVPYRDLERAVDTMISYFPEAPCLPATTRGIRWMLEGIPCVVIDREKKRVLMAPPEEREEELLEFYDRYDQDDLDYFATTPETAPFFYAMFDGLKKRKPSQLKWVVFHTAGPVLLGDTLKQLDGNPAIHHETLRDVLIKGLSMKSRWLEKVLKKEIPDIDVVVDQSETTLVTFTSAGGSGAREAVIEAINEGFQGLTCTKWVHCCANIDWTLLTDAHVDVINFDAYQHVDKVALYCQELARFLEKGGMIGWGIVPVVDDLLSGENVQSLVERLERGMDLFSKHGIDRHTLATSSWILPSCETVLLTSEKSDLVFGMTREISEIMKERYGFMGMNK
jgi:hypothetical protein